MEERKKNISVIEPALWLITFDKMESTDQRECSQQE